MNLLVMKESIDDQSLDLYLKEDTPCVIYQGKEYIQISDLFRDCPAIISHPNTASKLINFFLQGMRFEVILHPEEFIKNYQARIESEKEISSLDIPNTRSFGIFQVKEITFPKQQGNQLIFYAEDLESGVPYKVTFTFPTDQIHSHCNYQLLPAKN